MISFMPLYIDPGTGSMLFSLFIGIAATATFALRALFIKIKFILSGGKAEKITYGIEVSEAFSVGIYSMTKELYANLLMTRWNELKEHMNNI